MPRPRKPDAVKAAQGTLQKCRMRQVSTSGFELTLEPPIALTQDARDAWELAVKCAPKGVLVATDATVLERWARNYALYRKLAKAVEHDGVECESAAGSRQISPTFNAMMKVQQVLAACERELGFTPASRARVSGSGEPTEEANEFEDF